MSPETLASEQNLTAFLAMFEDHRLPKSSWTHAAHVSVAACYLFGSDPGAVLPRMRAAIRGYNESAGTANTPTSGYHETITVFWLRMVDEFLRQSHPASRLEAARLAVTAFAEQRALHSGYYSFNVATDTRARREWVEPDLQPISC
jgi:hypothetical protein